MGIQISCFQLGGECALGLLFAPVLIPYLITKYLKEHTYDPIRRNWSLWCHFRQTGY